MTLIQRLPSFLWVVKKFCQCWYRWQVKHDVPEQSAHTHTHTHTPPTEDQDREGCEKFRNSGTNMSSLISYPDCLAGLNSQDQAAQKQTGYHVKTNSHWSSLFSHWIQTDEAIRYDDVQALHTHQPRSLSCSWPWPWPCQCCGAQGCGCQPPWWTWSLPVRCLPSSSPHPSASSSVVRKKPNTSQVNGMAQMWVLSIPK